MTSASNPYKRSKLGAFCIAEHPLASSRGFPKAPDSAAQWAPEDEGSKRRSPRIYVTPRGAFEGKRKKTHRNQILAELSLW